MDTSAIERLLDDEIAVLDEETGADLEEIRIPVEEEELGIGTVFMFAEVEPGVRMAWFPPGNPEPGYCWGILTEDVDGTWIDESWCDSLEDCHLAAVS